MGYLHGFGWVGIALLIEADCTTTAVKATAAALTKTVEEEEGERAAGMVHRAASNLRLLLLGEHLNC